MTLAYQCFNFIFVNEPYVPSWHNTELSGGILPYNRYFVKVAGTCNQTFVANKKPSSFVSRVKFGAVRRGSYFIKDSWKWAMIIT